jgi:hypothetical protein
MFAGGILAHPSGNDHVPVEFEEPYSDMVRAFEIAGQGKISAPTLKSISTHTSVVYLTFPGDAFDQRERILKFTNVVRSLGGYAVKVESCGVAHEWESWIKLLSGNPFDIYCAFVTLIGDGGIFYSCGMHHFGLPECSIPASVPANEAADTMNRFNFWNIVDHPHLNSGETFSVDAVSPPYRLLLSNDVRHPSDHPFHNPHGVWSLTPV